MWRATFKGMLAHRWRLLRTALAVALGVGFVAGTFVLTDTVKQKMDAIVDEGGQQVDVVVRSVSEFSELTSTANAEPVPQALLAPIQRTEGVEGARGTVWGYAQMIDKTGEPIQPMGPPTLGGVWDPNDFRLVSGQPPTGLADAAVDNSTADAYGFAVGDEIQVLTQTGSERFRVAGIFEMPPAYVGATIIAFTMSTAQRIMDREGTFDSIVARAEPGISETELRDRIGSILPPTYEAVTQTQVNEDAKESLNQIVGFIQSALLVFALVALFVGAFIIFNTFSILVAQRTREIGLLRAVGASRSQVVVSVLTEALVVGFIASLAGLALGLVLALGMIELLKAFGTEESLAGTTLRFTTKAVVWSLASGVIVTVVSALAPARRATQVPPVVALGGSIPRRRGSLIVRVVVGGGVAILGIAGVLAGLAGAVAHPLLALGIGALLVFIGVAMLSALVARPLAAIIGRPFASLGEPAHLGRQNAMRNPRRTASTAAALMIGVGLVGFVTITASSLKASTTKLIQEGMQADYILQPTGMAMMGSGGVSPAVADNLRGQPAIGIVSEVRDGLFGLDGAAKGLIAVDPTTLPEVATLNPVTTTGIDSLTSTGVLVRERVARAEGWKIGDVLAMQYQSIGERLTSIQGFFDWGGTQVDYMIDLSAYEGAFAQQLDSTIFVKGAPSASSGAVKTAVDRAIAEYPNVNAMDKDSFTRAQAKQIDGMLVFIQALLGLSIVIALLGIANTLGMSIYERTRELGLLRAVGMSRRQLKSMVRWEAVIIGVIGAIFGLAVGIFFGWALVGAMHEQGVTEFDLPVVRLLLYVALAAVAGVIAALGPARRASKLDILGAIATE
jgi:putative ABC transport system permease protein